MRNAAVQGARRHSSPRSSSGGHRHPTRHAEPRPQRRPRRAHTLASEARDGTLALVMNREAQVVLALVATFAVACHGPDGFSAVDASSDDGGLNDEGGRPIDWAVAWVQGFYGTNYRGADVYSNTNDSGAPNGYYTSWRGDPGITLFANVSDCSSFSNTLLLRSYGWQPATAPSRPHAEDYYWAIRGGDGFERTTSSRARSVSSKGVTGSKPCESGRGRPSRSRVASGSRRWSS
jgi:hypothetical protein